MILVAVIHAAETLVAEILVAETLVALMCAAAIRVAVKRVTKSATRSATKSVRSKTTMVIVTGTRTSAMRFVGRSVISGSVVCLE